MRGSKYKQFCEEHKAFAYITLSLFTAIYLHGIEYGVDDYVIGRIDHGPDAVGYFRHKVKFDKYGQAYFSYNQEKLYLADFIRIDNPEER